MWNDAVLRMFYFISNHICECYSEVVNQVDIMLKLTEKEDKKSELMLMRRATASV